jgi:hypothetical protein
LWHIKRDPLLEGENGRKYTAAGLAETPPGYDEMKKKQKR